MNIDLSLKNLIITEYPYKIELLKKLNESSNFYDVKIMSKQELLSKYYYSYNEKAIYYLMDKYNINLDTALTYLKNLYYIQDINYNNEKLDNLVKIKKDLLDNNLLVTDSLFKDYLKNKNIIFYKYNYLSKLELDLIEKLKLLTTVQIINKEYKDYKPEVYEFETIFEEVEFVAISILKLIEKGISIQDIKLTNVSEEYCDVISFIFSSYNLKIDLNNNHLISNEVVKEFLLFSGTLEDKVNYITSKYNNKIVDQIINVANKYVGFSNTNIVTEMMINDFKNLKLKKEKYDNTIEIIDYKNYELKDEHIFLLGCNTSSVPVIYKDEDYIEDNQKEDTLLDTTTVKNSLEYQSTIDNILSIKNLVITYKNSTPFETYYPSNIIEDLNLTVIKDFKYDEIYSESYSKLLLGEMIDKYVLYNTKTKQLQRYNSTLSIPYNKYDNTFKGLDKNKLLNYFKDGFNLSYSSMDNFYKCGFKYYLANVLKINIYEDTFNNYIGSLFHYVLEKGLKEKIDIKNSIKEYIDKNERDLSNKEKSFIKILEKDIKFALDTIKDQLNNSSLKNLLFEERVEVIKNKAVTVTFKGFIDKIMYEKDGNNTIAVIIDYKTGNTDPSLQYLDYGLSMQLPIYLYLASNSKKIDNVIFGGFYLQKVLPKKPLINSTKSALEQRKDDLKLNGFSNSDLNILKKVDKNYDEDSMIKSMKILKNGDFAAYSKVVSNEDIKSIINTADKKIDDAIDSILNGEFNINPKVTNKANLGCAYCDFKDICYMTKKDEVMITPDKSLSFGGDDNA